MQANLTENIRDGAIEDATGLAPSSVRIEIHMSSTPHRPQVEGKQGYNGLSIGMNHVHQICTARIQSGRNIAILEQRSGWIQSWNLMHVCSCVYSKQRDIHFTVSLDTDEQYSQIRPQQMNS